MGASVSSTTRNHIAPSFYRGETVMNYVFAHARFDRESRTIPKRMDAGSSSLPHIFTGDRSRSREAEDNTVYSHQASQPAASHNSELDESPGSATHLSGGTTEPPPSPAHGKRKPALKGVAARKRLKSSNREPAEQPVAGPSRSTQPQDMLDTTPTKVPGVLTTTEDDSETDGTYLVSSVGGHYSPTGGLRYPDAGPSQHGAESSASSSTVPHASGGPIDVDALSDNIEMPRTQLLPEASSSTIGSMSFARLLNFEDDERPSPPPAQPRNSGPSSAESSSKRHPPAKLSGYNCPICFSPPTYATMTPCGHVCCGECLFTAVKTSIQRSVYHGPASSNAK